MTQKLIFITGVSSGLGRAIAAAALDAGHRVVGTLRRQEQVDDFEALSPGRAHARILDVTQTERIPEVVEEVKATFGPIDVLINNAGYGVEGTVEESSIDELHHQFDVNVFGVVAVTKAVLPAMRERRHGHIVFITSMGGLRAFPGLAYYHASKYAVEGFADSLRPEVAPLGIHVTSVEPGAFRTDWAGRSMSRVARTIPDYDAVFGPIRENRLQNSGHQPGDPAKAGRAICTILESDTPPGHLLLGSDALRLVREARQGVDAEIEQWKALTTSTDHSADTTA